LVLAANRDEFHERESAALQRWSDAPHIVGGRDLRAGGTWLAADESGRLGVITNYRESLRRRRSAPSRGKFIGDYLRGQARPLEYLRDIEVDATGFAGFSLLLADRDELIYASNRTEPFARPLDAGVYGLSNHVLDTPWPKLVRVRTRMQELLAAPQLDRDAALTMLADRMAAPSDPSLATGLPPDWERALSAPFVRHDGYGTRCSTLVTIDHDGATSVVERRFDRDGHITGETHLEFGDRS
jgi:uncharacterized protein with NRDE domain